MTEKQRDFALCLLSTIFTHAWQDGDSTRWISIPQQEAAFIVDNFCSKMRGVRVTIPTPKK